MFNLDLFVNENVIMRSKSMFLDDIESHREELGRRIQGKKVLVIGGAGSIGSSYIKAILPFEPCELVIVDTNENGLTELTRDLRSTPDLYMPKEYITYPMDYASPAFEKMFFARGGFEIVANFSAHKHVRSEKDIYSIEALIQNNVIHAKKLLDLLTELPPEVFFCVSTDKAANPVNIMGASKRVLEDVVFSYSDRFPVKTARFANVAFSNGSLPAGFLDRMDKMQVISAPKDVTRYFVSLEESGQICMLASFLGENREIFFPKLEQAQMMSFDRIAEKLLKVRGYEVLYCNSEQEALEKTRELKVGSTKYPVYFSNSDTSGEKLYEEFYTDKEEVDLNRFKALGVICGKEIPDQKEIEIICSRLDTLFESGTTKEEIINVLGDYLPYFEHIETGKSLDSKM